MKKFFIALLITVAVSTSALGATSNDIYLRQDIFEAKMDAFIAEIKLMNEQTRTELRKEIQANATAIQQTNARIDVTNARLEALITMVYWGIALLGILITLAAVAPSIVQVLQSIKKPSITLEDVERIIDAKLQARNTLGA
ncbi:MAG: hypothetical protein IJ587_06935 [Synergistaceae bacterium]|nr:hypothetical protein [Synergistaceae bacterium]